MNNLHQSLCSTFAGLLAASLAFGVMLLPAHALAQSSGLTQAQLANAAYSSEYAPAGTITLSDGQAEVELAPGSASKLVVTLIEPTAFGDLNGDGVDDAAVLLASDSGGSGAFIDLHAVLDDNGAPVDTASTFLGDRIQVNSLTIEAGVITVNMVTHGPNDPMCCPTVEQTLRFQLIDDALVEVTDEALSLETLGSLTYAADDFPDGVVTLTDGVIEIPAAPGSATTIRIERTGYAAFGDLNGDGLEDAAVILLTDGGGSGSFYYLATVVAEAGGGYANVATTLLGDRVIINDLTIADGVITVDMVVAGPDDPLCCPTQQVVRIYVLEGDVLTMTGESIVTAEATPAEFQPDATPNTATLSLGGADGFWLDPTLISVIGGSQRGDALKASALDAACSGVIGARPDVVLDWSEDEAVDSLRIFLLSLGDPMLLVVTPDGEVLCNDDYSPLMADPFITIDAPAPGRYAIFAGSFEDRATVPGFLVITSHDLNPAVMDLATLFPRQPNLDAQRNPQPADVMDVTGEAQAAAAAPITPDATPYTATLTAGGGLGAFDVALDNEACTGFITPAPTFAFTWEGDADALVLFFEATSDATLIVRDPDGVYQCNDDLDGADNLNPLLSLPALPGDYQVWVGGYAPDATFDGVLTITADASATPAPLTTDMLAQ